ncbi:hypothetical protein CLM82_05575, partial [Streptomyces albidoflavus]
MVRAPAPRRTGRLRRPRDRPLRRRGDLRPGRLRHRRLGHRLPQLHPGDPAGRRSTPTCTSSSGPGRST